MSLFDLIAIVVTVTAALGYLNRQLLGLPTAIGVMVGGLIVSLALLALDPCIRSCRSRRKTSSDRSASIPS